MDHGKPVAGRGVADEPLPAVEQGADLDNAGAVQVGDRLEAGQPSLIKQGEKEGLNGVVVVVAQRHLIQTPLQHGVVEGTPPHFRTQSAGIFLLTQVEDDVVDLRGHPGIGYVQGLAKLSHRAEVHARHPHIHGDGLQLKGDGVEGPQPGHGGQQRQGILSAGHADGDAVAGGDHFVVLDAPAGIRKNLFQEQAPASALRWAEQALRRRKRKMKVKIEEITREKKRKSKILTF